jgi:hypothetical protein
MRALKRRPVEAETRVRGGVDALPMQEQIDTIGSGAARSKIVLNYGVLAPLCDPILDRTPIYRATHQVAALYEAIEGYSDIHFANIAPARTGTS